MGHYPGEADGHDVDIDYEDCADEPSVESQVMTWTTNKPTQPGWYWVRMPDGTEPWIIYILVGEIIAEGREWAGPIPEPTERDERETQP